MSKKSNCFHSYFKMLYYFLASCFCSLTYIILSAVYLENFAASDYHRLALQELEACPVAMESLGAPPLKVHNIHLTDRYNRVDKHTAQVLSFRRASVPITQTTDAVISDFFLF